MNEVKANDPALHSLEAKTEFDHLLEEPKDDFPSVDDVLSFNKDGIKRSGTNDSTFEVRHGMETGGGGMALYTSQCKDDLNLGAFDGILDELEEVDIDFTNGLSGSCEDYFLDIDLAQEVSALGHGPCEGLRFGNSSSGSHSPGYSGSSNGAVGTSETSTVTTAPDMKCKDVDENGAAEGSRAAGSRAAGSAREKRQRRPPQRYIEESSKANSRQGHNQVSVVGKDKPPLWRQPKKEFTSLVEPEPKSLLRRVRELSTLHPYPRKTKTRSSYFSKSSL